MFLAFIAACFLFWVRLFIMGADDELNKGYKHRSVMESTANP
jgi:hypothetical protein